MQPLADFKFTFPTVQILFLALWPTRIFVVRTIPRLYSLIPVGWICCSVWFPLMVGLAGGSTVIVVRVAFPLSNGNMENHSCAIIHTTAKATPAATGGGDNRNRKVDSVESLQSHCIHTQFHWLSGPPVCFPSWGTQVQSPLGFFREARILLVALSR